MQNILGVLFFILTAISSLPAYSQSNAPVPENHKSAPTQSTQNNQTPSVYIPTPLTKAKDTQNIEENGYQQNPNLNLERIGIAQAFIFFAQLFVFGWQAIQLRQTVKSAQISDRPYIFVEVEGSPVIGDSFYCKCAYTLINHGKTPAILTNVRGIAWWGEVNNFPAAIVTTKDDWIPKGGAVIGSGKEMTFNIKRPMDKTEYENIKGANLKLLCHGLITYEDIFGDSHKTGFCWEYQNRISESGFYLSNNKELNYYT